MKWILEKKENVWYRRTNTDVSYCILATTYKGYILFPFGISEEKNYFQQDAMKFNLTSQRKDSIHFNNHMMEVI